MSTRPDGRAAWAAAALGAALTLWLFWPGLMSVDSALQYAQARGLRALDDVLPPLMTLAWRGLDAVLPGPGLMFLALVAGWWGGLAAVLARLPARRAMRAVAVLAIGLFPPTLVVLGHVWKDVAMCGALLWAVAAILAHARDGRARWRWLALLALALACTMRHNAIVAVMPLLAWLVWPTPVPGRTRTSAHTPAPWHARMSAPASARGGVARPAPARAAAGFALLACALAVVPALATHAVGARPTQAWTVVALWDLAAVSVATDRVLIPRELTFDEVTVDELRAAYVPYANPPLFGVGKFYVSLYQPYVDAKVRALQRAWFDAVLAHPREYLAHRARLSRYLLFGFPRALPRELVYVPARVPVPGSGYEPPPVDEHALGWRVIEVLRPTPLFAGATYLALAASAVGLALRRRRAHVTAGAVAANRKTGAYDTTGATVAVDAHGVTGATAPTGEPGTRMAVVALAASAWANALALLLVSGSAEFRYVAWTALASLLALAFAGARRGAGIG